MAIVSPQEPANGQQALQTALQELLVSVPDQRDTEAAAGASADTLQYSQPHQVYTIGLSDLIAGNLLNAAQAGTWRYFVLDPSGTNAIAEAHLATAADGSLSFAGLTYGPIVSATVDAIYDLEQNNPSVKDGDYELRFLQSPALPFYAVWLHGASDDIIRPIPPTPVSMLDPVATSPDVAIASLQTAAQNIQAQQDQAPGPSAG